MTKSEGYALEFSFSEMDYGEAREKAIRAELDKAIEKQDAESALKLYYVFMEENTFHGNDYNGILLFPEYTAFFEKHSELWDEYNHDLMWAYKWAVGNLNNFWQLPLEQIEKMFEQYWDFCKRFNYNPRSYYHKIIELMLDDIYVENENPTFNGMTIQEAYKKFLLTKRDAMSDCKACETDMEISYILKVENDTEKALKKAKPIFDGVLNCSEIPHVTYTDFSEHYFLKGDLAEADKYAKKAIRLILRDFGNDGSLISSKSICLAALAYSDPKFGFNILKKCLPYTVNNNNGHEMFNFNRAAYFLMKNIENAGIEEIRLKLPYRNEDIYNEDNLYKVSELKDLFYNRAKDIADKFDKRNGNSIHNELLNREYSFDIPDFNAFETKLNPKEELEISLLDLIRQNIEDDELPPGFSLPNTFTTDEGMTFADGAMDGILLYHSEPQSEDPSELEKIIDIAGEKKVNEAAKKTDEFFETHNIRTLTIIDEIQNYILENRDKLDANSIYSYGIDLTVGSSNRESVKLGLMVLELFCDYNEALTKAILRLGLSDEFTLFVIWAVRGLENGNDLIFELAKKTHQWGRIHAVSALEPETDEIKEWLLNEGIHNDVYPGYSSIEVFNKADVHTLLENGLTQEQLTPVGEIMLYLVSEGPTIGIKAFEDETDIMNMYLDSFEELEPSEADIRILSIIREKYDNDEIINRIDSMGLDLPELSEEEDEENE